MAPLFHLILHRPEIPNNTGAIGRACVAMGCALHLVRPLGFDTSEKALRRAGLDYWPRLNPGIHDSLDDALMGAAPRRVWLFSAAANRPVWDADLRFGDRLVLGSETRGLPTEVLAGRESQTLNLPLLQGERSLNVACAAVAILQEGLRQCVTRGEIALDASSRYGLGP